MKMKLDLSQFKLKHRDGKIATLVHPHGHEFRVAISALHPMNRQHLDSLQKHESPEIKVIAPKPMAKGGKIESKDKLDIERIQPPQAKEPLQYEAMESQEEKSLPPKLKKINHVDYEPMAEGGDVPEVAPAPQDMQSPETLSVAQPGQEAPQASPEQFNQSLAQALPSQKAPDQSQKIPEQPVAAAPQQPAVSPMQSQAAAAAVQPGPEVQHIQNQIADNAAKQQLLQNPDDPWGTKTMNEAAMQGLTEQKAGQVLIAQGQKAQGIETAKMADAAVKSSQALQAEQNDRFKQLDERRKELTDDIQNQHIDPQRYIRNMSTGDKISSAIGLILGGMAGGANGNQAMEFLNKQIERDIDSQKEELGKKKNLLAANLQEYGNLKDAMDFTRVNHNDVVANQMRAAAARQQGTVGSGELLKQAGVLDYTSANLLGQMAMRRSLLDSGSKGKDVAPESKIRALIPSGPEQDKHFKELADAEKTIKTRDNLLSAFDQVAKMQTLGARMGSPVQSSSRINALVEPLTAGMSKETAGRYTEQDAHAIKNLWPKFSDNPETVAKKRQLLEQINTEKANFPMLKSIGINPESFSKYKGAAEIKTLNGVQYQKVDGGWKKLQ